MDYSLSPPYRKKNSQNLKKAQKNILNFAEAKKNSKKTPSNPQK